MDYEFIRNYLKTHHITRAKFADDMGVSIYTVNNWFGRKPEKFPFDIALKISSKYKIPLENFYESSFWSSPGLGLYGLKENGTVKIFDEAQNELTSYESFSPEKAVLYFFGQLNRNGQNKALDYMQLLLKDNQYRLEGDS